MRAGALAALAVVLLAGCRSESGPRRESSQRSTSAEVGPASGTLTIPRASGPIRLDGELDEPDWQRAARTGPFRDGASQAIAHPYSDARLLRDDQNLYVGLYAADENIQPAKVKHDGPVWTGDAFSVFFRQPKALRIDISAAGVVTDARSGTRPDLSWESGIQVAVDTDGTADDPSDEDEEWVVEASIPLASLCEGAGCDGLVVEFSRCDTPKNGKRVCASWAEGRERSFLPSVARQK